ncbi:hypothetical protein MMC11_006971 [Xylographa trunciseda]|nr:hypothetical protein [Xylographa trunciseda]
MNVASSVAGLVGLAGLLLQSASFLYRFCSNYHQVAEEVSSLVGSIENLQALLRHIEDILRRDTVKALQSLQCIAEWDKRVKECEKDMGAWLQTIQVFQSGDAKAFKKCVRNLKAAADEGRFQKMRLRLGGHYEHLSLHLNILNGNIVLKNSQMLVATRFAADRTYSSQAELQRSMAYGLKGIGESTKRLEALGETRIDQIQTGLKEFEAQGSTNHYETIAYLERIEQRCFDTQMCLIRSIKKSRKSARGRPVPRVPLESRALNQVRRPYINDLSSRYTDSANESIENYYLVQVIKPAVLIYESSGSISRALMTIEDPVYSSRSLKEKIALVQQLQAIRLLIWLLRRDRVCCFISAVHRYPSVSILGLEGNLTFENFRTRVGPIRILRMLKEEKALGSTCYWLSSPKADRVGYYDFLSHYILQMARAHYFLDDHQDGNCTWRERCTKYWRALIGHKPDGDELGVSKDVVTVFRKLLSRDHCLDKLLTEAVSDRESAGKDIAVVHSFAAKGTPDTLRLRPS